MDRKALEAKAKELGVTFDDKMSDEDLSNAIAKEQEAQDKSKDKDYFEKELKKVIEQRDRVKAERNTMKSKMSELEEQMKGMVHNDAFNELQKELNDIKKYKKEIEEEKAKKEFEGKDEIEKAKIRADNAEKALEDALAEVRKEYEDKLKEREEKLESYKGNIESLRRNRLEAEIINHAVKGKAIEPTHIFKMLKNEFSYDSDLDKFVHEKRDAKGKLIDEVEVSDYITDFLKKEENDYLVRADSEHESMHTKKTTKATYTPSSGDYSPSDPSLIEKAEKEKMSVDTYIETLKMRDAKMAKVNEAKNAK